MPRVHRLGRVCPEPDYLGPRLGPGHRGPVTSVCWSSRGPSLVSGSDDRTVKLWDPIPESEYRSLDGYACVAWSPDGKFLATPAPKRQEQMSSIDVYEVASGRKAFSLPFPVSRHVFEIKAALEKVRELVQNVE